MHIHAFIDTKAGYGKSRKQIISIAENVAKDEGVMHQGQKISFGWYCRFMERQPSLSLRKGDPTANIRMDCLNEETIQAYFNLLKDVLLEHDLMDLPCQIYNVHETGIPLYHRPPKVVTKKGQKKQKPNYCLWMRKCCWKSHTAVCDI